LGEGANEPQSQLLVIDSSERGHSLPPPPINKEIAYQIIIVPHPSLILVSRNIEIRQQKMGVPSQLYHPISSNQTL